MTAPIIIASERPRGLGARIAAFYAALFLVGGTKLPYLPVWLDDRGLDAGAIALVTAAPLFVRIAAAPALAAGADATGDRRRAILLLGWLGLAASLALPAAGGLWSILVVALLMALASTGMMPLSETIAMAAVRRHGLDYGRMRLWGSLSFVVAGFVAGWAVERIGAWTVAWLLVVGAGLTLATALALPREERATEDGGTGSVRAPPWRPGAAAAHCFTRPFLLFLLAAGGVQSAHAVFYTFGVLHWRAQGIGTTTAGVLWAIGVAVEVGLFAVSGAVVRRVGAERLIAAGAVAALVRWAAMGFDPPLAVLVPLQALHGLTFAAAHLGAVHYIAARVPAQHAGTAQGLYAAVASGIGMGLATLAAGPLYAAAGGKAYFAMAAIGAASLAATVPLLRQAQRDGGS